MEKDGYFYPLHVATEAGHKVLTIKLVNAGADIDTTDYRYDCALYVSVMSAVH